MKTDTVVRAQAAVCQAERCCVNCPATMQGYSLLRERCDTCRPVHVRERKRADMAARRATGSIKDLPRGARRAQGRRGERPVSKAPVSKAPVSAPTPAVVDSTMVRTASGGMVTSAERKAQMQAKPNLGGDWFPGWDGCYPPTLSATERAYLESGVARVRVGKAPISRWETFYGLAVKNEVGEVARHVG